MYKNIHSFNNIIFIFIKLYAQDIQKDLRFKKSIEAGVLNEEEYNSARKIIEEKGYKEKVRESKKDRNKKRRNKNN